MELKFIKKNTVTTFKIISHLEKNTIESVS